MEHDQQKVANAHPRELPNAEEKQEASAAISKNVLIGGSRFSRSLLGWIVIISIGF